MEDIANGAARASRPAAVTRRSAAPTPARHPLPGDAYVTWRNPFVYFHSLIESPECAEDDVGLDQLAPT